MKSFLKNNNIILFIKIFKNTFLLCCFFILFLNENSFADIVRSTTFDDRTACEKYRGSWRDFGNSCVNKCVYKFDKYAVCSYAISFGCDCGKNRCLYEDKCILISEYKKIDEQQSLENEKVIEEVKKRRQNIAKKFQNDYLGKLSGGYGADPNRINPNRYITERELPPNTFRSTNRMLIYNHIIKKHNDKVLENAKINAEKNLNNNANQKEDSAPHLVKLLDDSKENSNSKQNNENLVKNSPIILKPIEEDVQNNENKNPENSQANLPNRIKDVFSQFDKISKTKDKKEEDPTNIPPVYVKKQNGEVDFKNGDVINNIENVPQFIN